MAESTANADAIAYIKERRKHRVRTAGQVVGATGAVMSGRQSASAALAERDPYSGLSSPMQKMQQSMEIYDKMAEEEMALYKAGLEERSSRLKLNVDAMMRNRQISSTAKQASARLRLQGNIAEAKLLEDRIESAMGVSDYVAAMIDKSAKMGNRKAAAISSGGVATLMNMDAGNVGFPTTAKEGKEARLRAKSGGGTPVPGTGGYNEDRGSVETGAEMMEKEMLWLGANRNASLREKRLHINNIEALAAITGVDPTASEAVQSVYDANGGWLTDYYASVSNEVNDLTSSEFEESEEIQGMLKRAGSGGATSEEAHAASMKEQVEEVYGEAWDPDNPLPGFGVVPKSDAHANYTKMLDTIEAQPERPEVINMKEHIQGQQYYTDWKSSKGYDDSMDANMIWREWTQDARQLEKKGRQAYLAQRDINDREKRKQNVEEGLFRARGSMGMPKKKALAASGSAKAVGGADKKPEDVAQETT